ncbi:MAG TPA: ankyrin repeat domain-containing protein [Patescibacteria group bacterium]|nr:ankyrin repeat domain-containing protein [Patescibacteria group bacterium]
MTEDPTEMGYNLVTGAAAGVPELVTDALAHGADIHFENDLALRTASLMGHFEIARHLVDKGANIHAAGEEALLYAAKADDRRMVEFLLAKGASIDDMKKAHPREIDRALLETLDGFESQKRREAFNDNFARVQRPASPDKFRLRKNSPKP